MSNSLITSNLLGVYQNSNRSPQKGVRSKISRFCQLHTLKGLSAVPFTQCLEIVDFLAKGYKGKAQLIICKDLIPYKSKICKKFLWSMQSKPFEITNNRQIKS